MSSGTAPAEAVPRIAPGRYSGPGAAAAGELFPAGDFLRALAPEHLALDP